MSPATMVSHAAIGVIDQSDINPELKKALVEYCKYEFREQALNDVHRRVSDIKNCEADLQRDFMKRLEFGTAGLRARMCISGTNVMNVLTVLQTTQGIASYLKKREGASAKGREVFVGYDGRHNSRKFAEYTAAAFAVNDFKTHLFHNLTPTPYTPFAVKKYGGLFGIQVTASHNPKDDNGYKVYDCNGAQIIPPVDKDIADSILENLMPLEAVLELFNESDQLKPHPNLIVDSLDRIEADYMKDMSSAVLEPTCDKSPVNIVYTAMHGVGSKSVQKFVSLSGFDMKNFHLTPQQDQPDPEFSTVSFPNPEEDGALNIAQQVADSVGASVIFANDPDADRFALGEKKPDGTWYRFHGNEIGSMLGHICMTNAKNMGVPYEKQLFVSTAVSSQMLKAIVERSGCKFMDTLTGFKWIMNSAIERCEKDDLQFILGYEEALGYATSMRVPDKDGVTAAGIFAQYASYLYKNNRTFLSYLQDLRKEYGTFVANNGYVKCYQPDKITEMFSEFRNQGNYVDTMNGIRIRRIRDVTTGYDNGEPDKKCRFPLIDSEMITFFLEDETVITLRTSGTEPKIKWYSEKPTNNPSNAETSLKALNQWVITNVFKPEKYPLDM